jgi:hypothetical protein
MTENKLLEKLLEGQDAATRAKVMSVVHESGLRESDPLFLLMVANSTVQVLLNQAPNDLRQTFNDCFEKLRLEYGGYEKAALAGMKQDIAKTVSQLVGAAIAKGNEAKNVVTYKSLMGAGFITLTVLLVGALFGFGASRWLVQMDNRGLTADEVVALKWGQSKEGRYAQQLFDWNPDLMNGECEARVRELGAMRVGDRRVTSGYCFLWTQPPSKRKFQE